MKLVGRGTGRSVVISKQRSDEYRLTHHPSQIGQWQVTVCNPWGTDDYSGDSNSDGMITLTYEEFTQEFMQIEVMNQPLAEQKSN